MKTIRKVLLWAVVLFVTTSVAGVVLYKYVPVPGTPLMAMRLAGQALRGQELHMHHQWVPLVRMSRHLPVAVMLTEDARFMQHHGFDVKEINNALAERKQGKRKRGASTISQQTAKNVFLCNGGGWVRKGFEVWFTVLIELVWGKERILEVYLNSIEMGDGVFGAEAVARQHFGCSAAQLTQAQCALIAVSLPNPIRMNSAKPGPYMLRRQSKVVGEIQWAEKTGFFGKLGD